MDSSEVNNSVKQTRGKVLLRMSGDPKTISQIKLDVDRQLPNHVLFATSHGNGKASLFNVLKAYSLLHPATGYCQAQAPIAAALLIHMPEEDAFWTFVCLCNRYMTDYFKSDLVSTWNVRTMWDTGRAFQIAAEMRRYNLEVLGISETHWTQVGQQRLTSGELLLYSGHEEENAPHTQGVALMLSKQAQNALIGWESHGPRIIKASFKTKKEGITMNIIQCYAPTNDYNSRIGCNFNAKVGTDNTGYEDIMGRHGLGERNENGERFANLCAFNKLVIGGTMFPHKRIHKTTWTSPDHTTQNQIDHICINKTFRRTIKDVRIKRGADIASDHHLLVAKMKLKLKKHWTIRRTISQKFNTAFLQDTNKLSNKFQAFHDLLNGEGTTVESNWKRIKEAIISTCHEVLGHKKHHHKEWITVDTLDKIQEQRNKKAAINTSRTRAEKAKAQAEYTVVNKQVKKSIRTDKRKYVRVKIELNMLFELVKKYQPDIYHHMVCFSVKCNTEPIYFAIDWFMCLYTRNLPWSTVLRILDMFFFEGVKVLFRIALSIFQLLLGDSNSRRRLNSMDKLMESLRNLPKNIVGEHVLINHSFRYTFITKQELVKLYRTQLKSIELISSSSS
ncbi:unnamed protein product [Schistosoma margrebowiei]|uniref:Uncharacterized protein n=1 Tax=Schistosoma margrebowiei TaxID=48269 RepID=A0A183MWG7_9TREM|nr:unnamed protein product [Schistosoma margrebowiei]